MANNEQKKGSALKYVVIIFFLVLIILALCGMVVYLKYGDEIYGNLARWGLVPERPAVEEVQNSGNTEGETGEAVESTEGTENGEAAESAEAGELGEGAETAQEQTPDSPEPAGEEPPESDAEAPPAETANAGDTPSMTYAEADALPYGLSLSKTDITIRALGTINTLFAGGGTGEYTWISQNPEIASVDQEGHITSVSSGRTNVLVTDGEMKGTCIVRIAAGRVSSAAKLNSTDVTLRLSDGTFRVRVTGASDEVGFLTNNPAVATVAADGTVTPVAPGTAIITAYWGDEYLLCTIRVPRES